MSTARRAPARQDHRLDVLLSTPLHRHMGLQQAEANDPASGLSFDATADLANNSDMLHGGLVAASLDVACAYAIFPSLRDDEVVLTNSLSISYLRPIPTGSRVRVRGEVVRRGSATAFLHAEVVVDGRVMATAQGVKSIVTIPGDA